MKKTLIFFILSCILVLSCGPSNRQIRSANWQNFISQNKNIMSYDQALIQLGQPNSIIEGDDIFIGTWGSSSRGTIAMPVGKSIMAMPVESGKAVKLIFNKGTRKLIGGDYKEW